MQPDSRLLGEVGTLRDRVEGARGSVAGAVDGDEGDAECRAGQGGGVARGRVELLAAVAVKAYDLGTVFRG